MDKHYSLWRRARRYKNFYTGAWSLAMLADISAIIWIAKGRWDIAAVLLIIGMQLNAVSMVVKSDYKDTLSEMDDLEMFREHQKAKGGENE